MHKKTSAIVGLAVATILTAYISTLTLSNQALAQPGRTIGNNFFSQQPNGFPGGHNLNGPNHGGFPGGLGGGYDNNFGPIINSFF
jgi:hypothetical protein